MNNSKIIQELKTHPRLNIREVAEKLKLTTFQVAEAQHSLMRIVLAKNRISPAWDVPAYNCNGLPWLNESDLHEALTRIESGETGVYKKLLGSFRVSTAQRDKIQAAQAIN